MKKNYFCFLSKSVLFFQAAVILFFLPGLIQKTTAQCTVDIDGNPCEWCCSEFTENFTFVHVTDPFGGDPTLESDTVDNQFTQGSTDADFKAWSWSQVKNKNDIANGAAVLVGTQLYFAGDRITTEGDAQIGFWFFSQRNPCCNGPGGKVRVF